MSSLNILNEYIEKQMPGTVPPRPGLVFDRQKHRWVRPKTDAERNAFVSWRNAYIEWRKSESGGKMPSKAELDKAEAEWLKSWAEYQQA